MGLDRVAARGQAKPGERDGAAGRGLAVWVLGICVCSAGRNRGAPTWVASAERPKARELGDRTTMVCFSPLDLEDRPERGRAATSYLPQNVGRSRGSSRALSRTHGRLLAATAMMMVFPDVLVLRSMRLQLEMERTSTQLIDKPTSASQRALGSYVQRRITYTSTIPVRCYGLSF
jgi:hypothetical protein